MRIMGAAELVLTKLFKGYTPPCIRVYKCVRALREISGIKARLKRAIRKEREAELKGKLEEVVKAHKLEIAEIEDMIKKYLTVIANIFLDLSYLVQILKQIYKKDTTRKDLPESIVEEFKGQDKKELESLKKLLKQISDMAAHLAEQY